jgi:hypothetical protein
MMSVATPVRQRQPVVVAATIPCAASMLGLGLLTLVVLVAIAARIRGRTT